MRAAVLLCLLACACDEPQPPKTTTHKVEDITGYTTAPVNDAAPGDVTTTAALPTGVATSGSLAPPHYTGWSSPCSVPNCFRITDIEPVRVMAAAGISPTGRATVIQTDEDGYVIIGRCFHMVVKQAFPMATEEKYPCGQFYSIAGPEVWR